MKLFISNKIPFQEKFLIKAILVNNKEAKPVFIKIDQSALKVESVKVYKTILL